MAIFTLLLTEIVCCFHLLSHESSIKNSSFKHKLLPTFAIRPHLSTSCVMRSTNRSVSATAEHGIWNVWMSLISPSMPLMWDASTTIEVTVTTSESSPDVSAFESVLRSTWNKIHSLTHGHPSTYAKKSSYASVLLQSSVTSALTEIAAVFHMHSEIRISEALFWYITVTSYAQKYWSKCLARNANYI